LILKLLSEPRIFKLLNWCHNQLISIPYSVNVFVPSVFGENIPTAEWGLGNDIGKKCLLGHRKKIAKFLTRTFT
jgi:hypothetical protein